MALEIIANALEIVGMDWKMRGWTRRRGDSLVNVTRGCT